MVVELLKDPPPAPTNAKTPSGADRRRSRRHAVTLPATMTPVVADGPPAPVDVRVRDISLHGAGLRSDVPLVTDATYFLDIGAGLLKLHARVRVVANRLRRDGSWDVGTAFVTAE